MKNQTLAFIDLETTGLLPNKHEIIEIGCVLARQKFSESGVLELEYVDEFEYKVKPMHIETADPIGLNINGYDEKDWIFAVGLKEAIEATASKVKNTIMVGHNVAFDFAFLEKAFEETGIQNPMHYHKLDTISIAYAKLHNHKEVEKFSLRALCDYLGIENKRAHSALSDARATYEIFQKLINM